jgi:DNA-binding GntR family transcriptional regulator
VDEHTALVDAMRAGDELLAVRRMDEHLRNVAATLNILEEAA